MLNLIFQLIKNSDGAYVPVDVYVLRVWWVHWCWVRVLKGHMTLQVINTWQCCRLVWRSVTQGTAQSHGIGSAAWDTVFWVLFEMQFTANSYIHPTIWRTEAGVCVFVQERNWVLQSK